PITEAALTDEHALVLSSDAGVRIATPSLPKPAQKPVASARAASQGAPRAATEAPKATGPLGSRTP
ncbi:MAG TPA: hypothetical protein VHN11_16100, partial [Xanthobacteraceae bacterium]|nr:hypothetical protein [Xanthobacteraceae bacterium]